ncbi:NAD(P)-dependent dehydrogenase (short-subunit alcohol dehydrogenase family) [Paenibacillus taihuensis]|uniref:NAD(P)-dependent dehydrogenase (Short-subunit alcohol dehydrogenase family) n=1 Tax=Paenibacillus taihuensis TaxID=1156355 RepID=A0A3D9S741_9BACL|nr:SDR family oxidoreductase [Paenibacillus taihuensis]REE86418.1 NAD(P)-dependent dehydrogenase (short-subunit alcohol dehydrogenase family) [Paenibacillus taihuensis]
MANNSSTQRIALVTGASGGMGRATAALLAAEQGMKVYLLARNKKKGQAAVEHVNKKSGRQDAELLLCDLASMASIRAAAAEIAGRTSRLDVLVNNAGVITLKREETADGFERQLGVNHLGHFLLTGLLIPLLRQSAAARVVNVSSGAHKIGKMNYADPGMVKDFTVWRAYSRSKIANIWFTKELARRLQGTGISVYALHPGVVATDIGVNRSTGFGQLAHKLMRPFFLTAEEGSATAIHLASAGQVGGQSGDYFYKKKPIAVSKLADSAEEASKFWSWSEQAAGFRYDI